MYFVDIGWCVLKKKAASKEKMSLFTLFVSSNIFDDFNGGGYVMR
jgi:hypothetical protein